MRCPRSLEDSEADGEADGAREGVFARMPDARPAQIGGACSARGHAAASSSLTWQPTLSSERAAVRPDASFVLMHAAQSAMCLDPI